MKIENTPIGIVSNKIIYDNEHNPVDFTILKVNRTFEVLTGLKREDISEKSSSHGWPEPKIKILEWLLNNDEKVLEQGSESFEQFCKKCKKWFQIQAYSDKKGYFTTIFMDITELKGKNKVWQESANQLKLLLDTHKAFSGTLEVNEILQALCDVITKIFSDGTAAIYLLRKDILTLSATYPPLPPDFPKEMRDASLTDHPHIKKAIRSATTVYVKDTASERFTPAEQEVIEVRQLRSITYFPLIGKQGILGVYIVGSQSVSRSFTESEIALFHTLSIQAIQAIENAQLFRHIQQELEIRTQTEKALKESEENLSITLNSIGDAVIATDIEGYITRMNPCAEQMTGWTLDEARDKKLEEIFHIVHAQTGNPVVNPIEKILKSGSAKGSANHTKLISRSGREYQISDSCSPVYDKDNKVTGTVLVFRDMTEDYKQGEALKASEERLDLAMSVANDGIWDWDLKTDTVYLDRRYYSMAGYDPGDFAQTLEEFQKRVHPDDLNRVMNTSENYLNGTLKLYDVEFRFKNGKGYWIWIRSRGKIVERDKDGKPTRFVGTHTDISKQKKAEHQKETALENLRASENHYKAVFNNTGTATIIIEEDTTISLVNRRFVELTGYTVEEIVGKMSWKELIVPEDLDQMVKYHISRRTGGKNIPKSYEFRLIDKHKQIHDVSIEVELIPSTKQSVASCLDITERKRNEQQVRKLSHAIEQNPASIVISDLHGFIEYINPKYTEVTGYSLEEVIGKNCNILKSGNTPDEVYEELWSTIKSGKVWKGEMQNKKKNGVLFWESVIISALRNTKGDITHFVEVKEDITEQKRKDLLHLIQFNIAQAVVIYEKTSDLLKVLYSELNKVCDSKNLVVALYDESTKTLRSILWQDEKDQFDEWPVENTLSGQIIKKGKPLILNKEQITNDYLSIGVKPIGTIPEYWLGVPLTIHGNIVGVIFTQSYKRVNIIDVYTQEVFTIVANQFSLFLEKRQFEKELIRAKEKAEESDRLKSAFLTNMSHEIRTPMNGILGFMDMLKDIDLTSKEREDYIDIINRSGQRLLDTVNDIIEMSKIESGEINTHLKVISPSDILQYLYKFFKPQAAEKGLYLKYNKSPDIHNITLTTDPQKLESILSNLIKNAIKFTNKGGIEFGSNFVDGIITFYVKDTGKGIPQHQKDFIFNRFVQGDMELTRGYEGSGLGLSIVKAYVDKLKGTIEVKSQKEKGSIFQVKFPARIIQKEDKIWHNNDTTHDIKTSFENNTRILIAEDDEISYRYLQTVLRKIGATLIRTTSGEETVEVLRQNQNISLVLMDIKMPGMDGLEATRKIREFNKDIPIIAQTAYTLPGDREKVLEAGCTEYVSKPIKKNLLLDLIKRCVLLGRSSPDMAAGN